MSNEDIFEALLGAAILAAGLYMYFKNQRKAGQKQEEQTGNVGTSSESILEPYDKNIPSEPPKTSPYYPPSTTPTEPKITNVYAPPFAEAGKDFTITVTGTNLKGKNLTIITSASEIYGIQISKSMNANSEKITIPFSNIRPELYPMIKRNPYLEWNAGFVIKCGTKELYRFSIPVQPTPMMTYANSMCRIGDVQIYGEYDEYYNSVTINKIDLIFSYVKYPFQLILPSQHQESTIGSWTGLGLGSMFQTGDRYYDGHDIFVEILTQRPDASVKSKIASGGKTLKDLKSSKVISIPVNKKFYIRQQPVIWLNIHYRYLDTNGNAKDFHNYWMRIDLTGIPRDGKVVISHIYTSPLLGGYTPSSVSVQKIMNSIRDAYINVLGFYPTHTSAELIIDYNPNMDAPKFFIATIKVTAELFKSGSLMDYSTKLATKTYTVKINKGLNRIPIYLNYSTYVKDGDSGAISATIYYNNEKIGYATQHVIYMKSIIDTPYPPTPHPPYQPTPQPI